MVTGFLSDGCGQPEYSPFISAGILWFSSTDTDGLYNHNKNRYYKNTTLQGNLEIISSPG